MQPLQKTIEEAWEQCASLSPAGADPRLRQAVEDTITLLDEGRLRVAEKSGGRWITHQWVKKAVLLSFRLQDNAVLGAGDMRYYDKVPSKFARYGAEEFGRGGFRVVPPAAARKGAYIAKNVVLMPSFVNIGAYVDEGTMVDTWATVGSCAQIGKNVHLSGAVISMGVFIGASTRIYDRQSGRILYGRVPAGAVVVPGSLPSADGKCSLYCAVIVKQVDTGTRAKTSINELLRSD